MSFLTIIFDLKSLLRQPGCPICKVYDQAAWRYVETLHWENINDPNTRQLFLASWGYCPDHTRLVAQVEQAMFGDWLGTNILYESLSQYVHQELERLSRRLEHLQSRRPNRLAHFFQRLRANWAARSPLPSCPVCTIAESSAHNALSGLLEALEQQVEEWAPLYQASEGICLRHLRLAFTLAEKYPHAVSFILQTRLDQLEQQSAAMKEYIRKHAWEYRHEPISETEQRAWQENLAFFSGLTPTELLKPSPHK